MSLARELEVACDVALEAASVVLSYAGRPLEIERKHGGEPVTAADHAANDLIVRRLGEAFPRDAILSEELPDDGSRMGRARVWMVDPVDGTRDLIRGDTDYTVMIGLSVDGRPRVGAVVQPATGLLWAGAVGEAAWKRLADGSRAPLRPSSLTQPPGIRLVASKSHRTSDLEAARRALAIEDEMNVGSVGLKIGLVAEGTRDLYVYGGGRTKMWDSCAPEAILTAAGGRVTDTFGEPLSYLGADLHNRGGIVASNGPLHEIVLATLATLRG